MDISDQLRQPHIIKQESFSFAYGGCTDIWKGRWKDGTRCNDQMVAVKVPRGTVADKPAKKLIQESEVWSLVAHPNIMPFLGLSFDFHRPGLPCLVSPLYQHGDIIGYLRKNPHINRLSLLAQVADALSYLHNISIIHGDIKGSNILINDDGRAILTDFGLSAIIQPPGVTTRTATGTRRFVVPDSVETKAIRWQAPELLESDMEEDATCIQQGTLATDVWAFGMTVIEIFTGRVPFSHLRNDAKVVVTILEGGRPKREECPTIKADIWRMMERCWAYDPNQRPSMANVSHFLALQSTQHARL